jgi:uncharacterized membrane protein YebE (DUF533 family)
VRQQVFRKQLDIVRKPSEQSHAAEQKRKSDSVLGAATEGNLVVILIGKGEVAKKLGARQVDGQILEARARMPYDGDLNWEKQGCVHARRIQPTSGRNEGLPREVYAKGAFSVSLALHFSSTILFLASRQTINMRAQFSQ